MGTFNNAEETVNFIQKELQSTPSINVINKEDFEARIDYVFEIIWEVLAKSFGPGGAGTFISIYPGYYNTKDGFNIMKNLAFDHKIDQVICDMIASICNRLNFTVGDGTTTATIATRSIYNAYKENSDFFKKNHILPRDILYKMEDIKKEIISRLNDKARMIQSDDPDELYKNIYDVLYISSNGNKELSDMIAKAYKELRYPAITCSIAKDGITKLNIIDGIKMNIALTDEKYTNTDNKTMDNNGADVIVFDHKVGREVYEVILKPLSENCGMRGRHLICVAPFYDSNALQGVIGKDLNEEMKRKGTANLVLCVCGNSSSADKVALNDFAMLLNTQMINSSLEEELLKTIDLNPNGIFEVFDIDNRNIKDINIAVITGKNEQGQTILSLDRYEEGKEYNTINKNKEGLIRIGFCESSSLGMKESTFTGFHYNEKEYSMYLSNAKSDMEETKHKCETMGVYSQSLLEKQQRYYSLGLKTGMIEVGSTSEINQGYLKDTVDDAIKAAESAFNNGVVLGCNVSTIQVINDLIENNDDELTGEILRMLKNGFYDVYETVLANVIQNITIDCMNDDIPQSIREETQFSDFEIPDNFNTSILRSYTSIYDFIIDISVTCGKVFDLSTGKFSEQVVNSTETDREVLKATIDLLSLLITGNQLVLR